MEEALALSEPWTLWFTYIPTTNRRYISDEAFSNKLMLISTFDTMKEFLMMYNYMPATHTLQNATYYYFKRAVQPKWNDPHNKAGTIVEAVIFKNRNKFSRADRECFEETWQFLLYLVIGGTMPDLSRHVNGLVCKVRENFLKVELWCPDAAHATVSKVRETLAAVLPRVVKMDCSPIAALIAKSEKKQARERERARRKGAGRR